MIKEWWDHTDTYGMGYQLTNGTYGILFNDQTCLVSKDPKVQHFTYGKQHKLKAYSGGSSNLKKDPTSKRQIFKKFLKKHKKKGSDPDENTKETESEDDTDELEENIVIDFERTTRTTIFKLT